MLKRIATFLLGIALVSMGVLFFIAPERAFLFQILVRYWPVFLILAGIVRVGGHLLDRQPRSPVGGMLLGALGGILLAANLRGETRVLEVIGSYWFFILLAIVAGRVMRQYAHRPEDGPRPRAFSIGGVIVMVLVSATGLGAYWLGRHSDDLARLRLPFRLNDIRSILDSEYSIADSAAQGFLLGANSRLVVDGLEGDVEVHTVPGSSATARIVKRIRASSDEEARIIARRISLDIKSQGDDRTFSIAADGVRNDFLISLLIELPGGSRGGLEANAISGQVILSGLKGEHSIRDVSGVTVTGNEGSVNIDGAGSVQLQGVQGKVTLARTTRVVSLKEISGPVVMNLSGASATLDEIGGPIEIEGRNARIELHDIGLDEAASPAAIACRNLTDSRLSLNRLRGDIRVEALRTRIDASEISGDLSIKSSAERVKLARVSGKLRVVVEDGSIEAVDLDGPSELQATREISVRNFENSLTATSRLGAITMTLEHQVGADISAASEHGSVSLSLPEDSQFRLDASTGFGRLRVRGFDYLDLPRRQRATSISYGNDPQAPLLTLRSTNGDINVSPSGTTLANRVGRAAN